MFKNKKLLVLFIIANIWGVFYILWRGIYTVNYGGDDYSLAWSIILLLAEIFSMGIFISFSLAVLRKDDYQLPTCPVQKPDKMPSIDIFVCSLNEDKEILKPTLMAAMNIDYPHKKVYLLDDGSRPEMFELTKRLGCQYITRDNNVGFKAGNVNNALKQTDGEIVIIFDADHIPVSTFIKDIICNFADPKVALIQTPQHFFNPDPFQKNLNLESHISNEQDLFYRVIEPGLSTYDATICGGTNFFLRRSYVEAAGGFPEDSLTEDFALSVKLESKGYKVLYYNKPVATGKSTETFGEYLKQRSRWAKGNLSVIYSIGNFKNIIKLKPVQIFFHVMGVSYFFYPFARLIFLLSPVMFVIFGLMPVNAIIYQLAIFQVTYFAFKIWFFVITSARYRHVIFTDVYESATTPFLAKEILFHFLIPSFIKKPKFLVTDKSKHQVKKRITWKYFLPLLLIIVLLVYTNYLAISKLYEGAVSEGAYLVNIFWNTYNLIIMIFALRVSVDKDDHREDLRIPIKHDVMLINKTNEKFQVKTINMSNNGALLNSNIPIPETFLTDSHIILPGCDEMGINFLETIKKEGEYFYRTEFISLCGDDSCLRNQDACFITNMFAHSDDWDEEAN